MSGEAQTTQFMLGSATLMIGPQADMFDLLPAAHSLGLVKNIKVQSAVEFKDLTQGVQNKMVFSVKTGNKTTVSAEVFEYTNRNMAYALGLDGGVNALTAPAQTSLSSVSTTGAMTLTVSLATNFAANDFILISDPVLADKTYIRRIASIATNVLTLTTALPAAVLPVGTVVTKISGNDIGATANPPFFSCKVIGETAEGKPGGFMFPKVRITSNFDYGFMTDDYANIPFELTVFDLIPTDPHYALFSTRQGLLI